MMKVKESVLTLQESVLTLLPVLLLILVSGWERCCVESNHSLSNKFRLFFTDSWFLLKKQKNISEISWRLYMSFSFLHQCYDEFLYS